LRARWPGQATNLLGHWQAQEVEFQICNLGQSTLLVQAQEQVFSFHAWPSGQGVGAVGHEQEQVSWLNTLGLVQGRTRGQAHLHKFALNTRGAVQVAVSAQTQLQVEGSKTLGAAQVRPAGHLHEQVSASQKAVGHLPSGGQAHLQLTESQV